mmetsp:Transcript_245/g.486  ORF Transcript_245/g.486 Transcript_245/m.486 type:complete len:230 (-) Transcript_245:103-792(-)|eukprot:CAMPEP_0204315954 /NCGR_PEP_ID=MMETSP0469-20131031/5130_1 /ASSEMBLY_ACC=CAM_ASM_000384 /TAXON_ID=2969 /ORGANISM="Oxyrrhis marina" /LENGTH=229 /DNA_ID=CAMNT_0051296677 /DNA_START=26 /DNA_END=715 /DNA_ORIENTATION=+
MVLRWGVAALGLAALPPGYEDELFCPPGYCRQGKIVPAGFVGPASSFHECISMDGNTETVKVTPWGSRVENAGAVREKLIADGYHQKQCPGKTGGSGAARAADSSRGMQTPARVSWDARLVLAVPAVVLIWWLYSRSTGAKAIAPAAPDEVRAARTRYLEKMEQEVDTLRSSEEWQAKQEAAKREGGDFKITSEHRKSNGLGEAKARYAGNGDGPRWRPSKPKKPPGGG